MEAAVVTRLVLITLGVMWVAAFLAAFSVSATAASDADFDPSSYEWNGLAKTLEITRSLGYGVSITHEYDFADPRAKEILVVVFPRDPLDPDEVYQYLLGGGRIFLANDFGEGLRSIPRLKLEFSGVHVYDEARNYRGRAFAPVVGLIYPNKLTDGVLALLANHPSYITTEGGIIAQFYSSAYADLNGNRVEDEGEGAAFYTFAAAKEVGKGKIVAVADSSFLINRMIEAQDNRVFYSNALNWLSDGDASYTVTFLIPRLAPEETPVSFASILLGDLGLLVLGAPLVVAALGFSILALRRHSKPSPLPAESPRLPGLRARLTELEARGDYTEPARLLAAEFVRALGEALWGDADAGFDSVKGEVAERFSSRPLLGRLRAKRSLAEVEGLLKGSPRRFDRRDFEKLCVELDAIVRDVRGRGLWQKEQE